AEAASERPSVREHDAAARGARRWGIAHLEIDRRRSNHQSDDPEDIPFLGASLPLAVDLARKRAPVLPADEVVATCPSLGERRVVDLIVLGDHPLHPAPPRRMRRLAWRSSHAASLLSIDAYRARKDAIQTRSSSRIAASSNASTTTSSVSSPNVDSRPPSRSSARYPATALAPLSSSG